MAFLAFFLLQAFIPQSHSALVKNFTVGGFGNGASFAHQLHVAYGTTIQSAGLVAPAPYYCSMGSYAREVTSCRVNPYLFSIDKSTTYFKNQGTDGKVDPVSALANDRAYLVSGTRDTFTLQGVVQNTESFYRTFITNNYQLITNYTIPAGHAWITDSYGGPCWSSSTPNIVNCGFDLAGDMLLHLLGTLYPKGSQDPDNLHTFDQSVYGDPWQAGMSSRGFVYLPRYCIANDCKVIVMFHGCHQNYDHIGKIFVTQTGINEWAETNRLIIIYPQTISTKTNPAGCWDIWGYTGSDFSLQSGLQMNLVHGIAMNPPVSGFTSHN